MRSREWWTYKGVAAADWGSECEIMAHSGESESESLREGRMRLLGGWRQREWKWELERGGWGENEID